MIPAFTSTPAFAKILSELGSTLLVTAYAPGRLIKISAENENRLSVEMSNFQRPMGIAVAGDAFAIATRQEIIHFHRAAGFSPENIPDESFNAYDSLFLPRQINFTGEVDLHDLAFGNGDLYGVNTGFSCIVRVNHTASWEPVWLPPSLKIPQPGDWYHLNGMAMHQGKPRYVSSLGKGNKPNAWRDALPYGGMLWDIDANAPLLENLPMPHSPRMAGENLWMLLSATGELIKVNLEKNEYQIHARVPALLRGMAITEQYCIVGASRIRQNASAARHLYIGVEESWAGVLIIDRYTGAIAAELRFEAGIEDLFDIAILPGIRNPKIIGTATPAHRDWIISPDHIWKY